MATRLRKSRKQRGSRYCGWGQIGQHRASGSRGGVGGAGKHKHFYIRTLKEEPDHFGHEQFHALRHSDITSFVAYGRDQRYIQHKTLMQTEHC